MFLRGEDAPRVIEEALASGRELGVSAGAVEECDADLILERPDLARQVRLADAEALRRAREMQLLGEGDEVPILPQFEWPDGSRDRESGANRFEYQHAATSVKHATSDASSDVAPHNLEHYRTGSQNASRVSGVFAQILRDFGG